MKNEFKRKLKTMYKKIARTGADPLHARTRLQLTIKSLSQDNQVAVVYGGVDCDGGMWDNRVDLVPANVMSVVLWERNYYESAEGSQWHQLAKPSEVATLEGLSRDLTLEAFEEGHPHSIHFGGLLL